MSEHELESKNFDPDFEPVVNHSGNTSFADVLASRMPRRTVMKGTMGAALAGIMGVGLAGCGSDSDYSSADTDLKRSEEHTSELQSRPHLVCRLLLQKK